MTTAAEYEKPMPEINDLNRPHWEGAKQHEFRVQRCRACGHMWFPPMTNCSRCLGTDLEWFATSGKGKVFSFIVYHQGRLHGGGCYVVCGMGGCCCFKVIHHLYIKAQEWHPPHPPKELPLKAIAEYHPDG